MMSGPEKVLAAAGIQYKTARQDAEMARLALKRVVRAHLEQGVPEQHVAAVAGIDRMTVRKWRRQDG